MINSNRSDWGKNLRAMRETKAISTLLLILLLLCSAIIGGLISYLWVLASFYNVPENSTMLVIEHADFSVADFSYFNLTILNPSYSASDVNITAFRLTVLETNETSDVNTTEIPGSLPYLLQKGVRQTFKCIDNWSNITGKTVRIDALPANVLTLSNTYTLPTVDMTLTPIFDASQTVNYFNLTAENAADSVNLTISDVMIFDESLKSSITPSLPYHLQNNQNVTFTCYRNWEDLKKLAQNVTIIVDTAEGYELSYTTNRLPEADLQISDVEFDYADPTYFNLTITSLESSTTSPTLSMINVTQGNVSSSLYTFPPLNITGGLPIAENQSMSLKCFWDWSLIRDQDITISAYTKQGFTIPTKTVRTPSPNVWNVTDVKFDLDDLAQFWVNVTNMPCSLNSITVAKIQLNNTETTLDSSSTVLTNGTQVMFDCKLNWANYIGQTTNVTVFTADGENISEVVTIPYVQVKILGDDLVYGHLNDATFNVATPYINVTISNSANSILNVTISKIALGAGNITQDLVPDILYPNVASRIYVVDAGQTVTFVCYSDYTQYLLSPTITVTVYISTGLQVTKTWHR
jgi:hypothetical protein